MKRTASNLAIRLALAASLLPSAAAQAQAQHFATNEELRNLRAISGPLLSPDGKHVVAILQDSTGDGGRQHLWLLSVDGSEPRQLTFSDKGQPGPGETNPAYLPDGTELLFTRHVETGGRLFRLPLTGGEPVAVKLQRSVGGKDEDISVSSYVVSPKGDEIAVIATDPDSAAVTAEKKDKKDVTFFEHDEHLSRLYLLNTQTWKAQEVAVNGKADQVSWTEDGHRLLLLTHTSSSDLGPSSEAWIIDPNATAAPSRVTELPASTERAVWMHDGAGLLVLAQCELDAPAGCADLYVLRLGTPKLRNLTRNLHNATLSGDTFLAADEHTAILGIERGFEHGIATVDLATGAVTPTPHAMPVTTGWKRGLDGKTWVYLATGSTAAPAVYLTTSLTEPGRRLQQPVTAPADWKMVPSRPLTWKRAGLTIEGRLYLPETAGPTAKVPLVVNVHGGPTGAFTDNYSPLTNLLVAQGWAVLQTNPRGSTGYGVAFEAANKDDMGNGDFLDIMAGVDEAIRSAPIDPGRMALIGYSYGGEMAGFVEGKTNRFKALVSGAPVIDQFSEYGTESDSFGDKWFTGQPWLHFESAWRQSPLSYARDAKTPFLLLQGTSDTTDPEGQSLEMYRALRQEGVPVQMLLFPREDHGALGRNFAGAPSTEPWHGITAREHMINFIRDAFAGKVEPNPK